MDKLNSFGLSVIIIGSRHDDKWRERMLLLIDGICVVLSKCPPLGTCSAERRWDDHVTYSFDSQFSNLRILKTFQTMEPVFKCTSTTLQETSGKSPRLNFQCIDCCGQIIALGTDAGSCHLYDSSTLQPVGETIFLPELAA